jgi:glycosyltransferase 2 family protein
LGFIALFWVLRDFDLGKFLHTLEKTDYSFLVILAGFIIMEQVIRGFKWGLILKPFGKTRVLSLFGAVMLGYFSNYLVPVRISPLVRGWVIARMQKFNLSTVLATIGVDRIIDGLVFIVFSLLAVLYINFPEQEAQVKDGILIGTGISFVAFIVVIAVILILQHYLAKGLNPIHLLVKCLPNRWEHSAKEFFKTFVESAVMPKDRLNIVLIVAAAVMMKLIAASHFYWAGLAFGVSLQIWHYIFLMVFLGYLIILVGVVRIAGGFTAGVIFVLGSFGVSVEDALAMSLTLFAVSKLSVGVCGLGAFWGFGIKISEIKLLSQENLKS